MLYVQHATIYKLQLWDITMVTRIYNQLSLPCYDGSITKLTSAICLRWAETISQYSHQLAHKRGEK